MLLNYKPSAGWIKHRRSIGMGQYYWGKKAFNQNSDYTKNYEFHLANTKQPE